MTEWSLPTTAPRPNARSGTQEWRCPDARTLRVYLRYVTIIGTLFVAGYGGANWLAAHREAPYRLYLDAELDLPLVPWMIWPYASINLLFLLPVFRLDAGELRGLGRQMIAATLIAVLCFLAAPTAPGFARLDPVATISTAFALLYALDYPFNCAPSLHVAYSTLLILSLAANAGRWLRAFLAFWLLFIMASTVLTHQHHLFDIAAALALVAFVQLMSSRLLLASRQLRRGES